MWRNSKLKRLAILRYHCYSLLSQQYLDPHFTYFFSIHDKTDNCILSCLSRNVTVHVLCWPCRCFFVIYVCLHEFAACMWSAKTDSTLMAGINNTINALSIGPISHVSSVLPLSCSKTSHINDHGII